MRYDVTFQIDGDELTQSVDAPDAASAVAAIEAEHGHSAAMFELIQVHLLEDPVADEIPQESVPG